MTIDTCAPWPNARHRGGRFEIRQLGAAKLMQRVCRRLWLRRRRHVTLYSTRYLAASRFKGHYGHAEVAALMGHGARTTAGTHDARTARTDAARPRKATEARRRATSFGFQRTRDPSRARRRWWGRDSRTMRPSMRRRRVVRATLNAGLASWLLDHRMVHCLEHRPESRP